MSDRIAHHPVHRSGRTIALEIGVTVAQAYLAGVAFALAVAPAQAGSIAALLLIVSIALMVAWVVWLLGGPGWLLAAVNLPLVILSLDALIAALGIIDLAGIVTITHDAGLVLGALAALIAAVIGFLAGIFLPGPRQRRWRHSVGTAQASATLSTDAVAERLRARDELVTEDALAARTAPPVGPAPVAVKPKPAKPADPAAGTTKPSRRRQATRTTKPS